jgi:hypothetical protein
MLVDIPNLEADKLANSEAGLELKHEQGLVVCSVHTAEALID